MSQTQAPLRGAMTSSISNILIVGNQILSTSIIQALLSSALVFRITILTYDNQILNGPTSIASSVEHKTSDFTFDSLTAAFAGEDLVISTIHGGDYELQTRIIDACIAAGVKKFIPHEFGQDSQNLAVQERLPPLKERARVIGYLRYRQNYGLQWIAVATGYPLDQKLVSGDMGFDLKWFSALIHGTGDEVFVVSSLSWVGIVVRRVVELWDELTNRYIYASGNITIANDVVSKLEEASKRKWDVSHTDVQDCMREGEARIAKGFPDAGVFLLERSVLYDRTLNSVDAFIRNDAKEVLGLREEEIGKLISNAVRDFKKIGINGDCGCG